MMLSVVIAFAVNLILILLKEQIIHAFTDIEGIAIYIRQAWTVFNMFIVFDTTQGIAAAVIRASGQ